MIKSKSKATKTVAPAGTDLSDAVSLVLKDNYIGPVNVSIVTQNIKTLHPNWKLPERRVNKFVKRYMSKDKNPAGADDDATVIQYKKKKATSPSRSLFRMISSRSKKKKELTSPEQLELSFETFPETAPEPVTPKGLNEEEGEESRDWDALQEETDIIEEKENSVDEEKGEKKSNDENEPISTEKEDIENEIAHDTDHDKVDSADDCFTLCSMM